MERSMEKLLFQICEKYRGRRSEIGRTSKHDLTRRNMELVSYSTAWRRGINYTAIRSREWPREEGEKD